MSCSRTAPRTAIDKYHAVQPLGGQARAATEYQQIHGLAQQLSCHSGICHAHCVLTSHAQCDAGTGGQASQGWHSAAPVCRVSAESQPGILLIVSPFCCAVMKSCELSGLCRRWRAGELGMAPCWTCLLSTSRSTASRSSSAACGSRRTPAWAPTSALAGSRCVACARHCMHLALCGTDGRLVAAWYHSQAGCGSGSMPAWAPRWLLLAQQGPPEFPLCMHTCPAWHTGAILLHEATKIHGLAQQLGRLWQQT